MGTDFSLSSDTAGALTVATEQFLAMNGLLEMIHCLTTFLNSLQGTFSFGCGSYTMGPQMSHKTAGVLFR